MLLVVCIKNITSKVKSSRVTSSKLSQPNRDATSVKGKKMLGLQTNIVNQTKTVNKTAREGCVL